MIDATLEASPKTPEDSHLTGLVKGAFKVINATNLVVTKSCWLCYGIAPPYYEGIAYLEMVNQTEDANVYRWQQQ